MLSPVLQSPAASLPLPRRLAIVESFGFALIVAVIWADELLDVPHYLFGAAATPLRPSEALFESAAVTLLGIVVITLSVRMARRVAYFESLVVLCAWCRRVRHAGQWTTLEAFLTTHQAVASHGMCPQCEATFGATPS